MEANAAKIGVAKPISVTCVVCTTINFDGWLKGEGYIGVCVKHKVHACRAMEHDVAVGAIAAVGQANNEIAAHIQMLKTRHQVGVKLKADVNGHTKIAASDEQWV